MEASEDNPLQRRLNLKLFVASEYARAFLRRERSLEPGILITGDIDDPSTISRAVLERWLVLASRIAAERQPLLFVTVKSPDDFRTVANFITGRGGSVGLHGLRHIHYDEASFTRDVEELKAYATEFPWFRFPFLYFSTGTFKTLSSSTFCFDSSIVASLPPFKVGHLLEFPVTPPTDTYLRDRALLPPSQAARRYKQKLREHSSHLTLLWHPCSWTIEMMEEIL